MAKVFVEHAMATPRLVNKQISQYKLSNYTYFGLVTFKPVDILDMTLCSTHVTDSGM